MSDEMIFSDIHVKVIVDKPTNATDMHTDCSPKYPLIASWESDRE